ncbi:MAG: phosphatidylglycerophosphatase A [Candidatus Latescibacterota bacterium]|nr:phosphatidylglycerophosphatase A [Candidatus Latescibacterota bacterium]
MAGTARRSIGTVLFSGYAPIAPGTAGSAVTAVAYYYLCASLNSVEWVLVLGAVFLVAVYTAGALGAEWGEEDPGRVVIDEAVGYLVTVAFLPHSFWIAFWGFLVFRFFDIAKPVPIRRLEGLPGGWGIVLDDVAAGIYSQILIRGVLAFTG